MKLADISDQRMITPAILWGGVFNRLQFNDIRDYSRKKERRIHSGSVFFRYALCGRSLLETKIKYQIL